MARQTGIVNLLEGRSSRFNRLALLPWALSLIRYPTEAVPVIWLESTARLRAQPNRERGCDFPAPYSSRTEPPPSMSRVPHDLVVDDVRNLRPLCWAPTHRTRAMTCAA